MIFIIIKKIESLIRGRIPMYNPIKYSILVKYRDIEPLCISKRGVKDFKKNGIYDKIYVYEMVCNNILLKYTN